MRSQFREFSQLLGEASAKLASTQNGTPTGGQVKAVGAGDRGGEGTGLLATQGPVDRDVTPEAGRPSGEPQGGRTRTRSLMEKGQRRGGAEPVVTQEATTSIQQSRKTKGVGEMGQPGQKWTGGRTFCLRIHRVGEELDGSEPQRWSSVWLGTGDRELGSSG
jgi:hypothetical protein